MKTNLQFLKDLIDSDFLLLNYSKEFNFKIKQVVDIKTQHTFSLDLLESNRNLKQFIRNLQYLTKSEIYLLQILIKNKYLDSLCKKCLLEADLKNQYHTATMASKLKGAKKTHNMLLLLGNTSKDLSNNAFFEKNLLLVHEIHAEVSVKYTGKYKIFNDITSLNKATFILCLISQILRINYENRKQI